MTTTPVDTVLFICVDHYSASSASSFSFRATRVVYIGAQQPFFQRNFQAASKCKGYMALQMSNFYSSHTSFFYGTKLWGDGEREDEGRMPLVREERR
jgi:hypothetical protein